MTESYLSAQPFRAPSWCLVWWKMISYRNLNLNDFRILISPSLKTCITKPGCLWRKIFRIFRNNLSRPPHGDTPQLCNTPQPCGPWPHGRCLLPHSQQSQNSTLLKNEDDIKEFLHKLFPKMVWHFTPRVEPGISQKGSWVSPGNWESESTWLKRCILVNMMEPTKIGSLKKIFDVGGGWATFLTHLGPNDLSFRGTPWHLVRQSHPNNLFFYSGGERPVPLLRSRSLRPIGGKERDVISRWATLPNQIILDGLIGQVILGGRRMRTSWGQMEEKRREGELSGSLLTWY